MSRLGVAALALVALLVPTGAESLGRTTTDRPDDIPGSQVHFVYAVPADGDDRSLDADGTLIASVDSLARWIAGQIDGRRLRVDTYLGRPDITFLRLSRPAAFFAGRTDANLFIRAELVPRPNKLYAVYFDGATASCGSADLSGPVAAIYLRSTGCGYAEVPRSDSAGRVEHVMVHELLHALGAVPSCAPHFQPGHHTDDDQRDLMYEGTPPYWLPEPVIDPGRDDYYGHGRPDCLDVARSLLLAAPGTVRLVMEIDGQRAGVVRVDPRGVRCPPTCETDVPLGASVTLTALPAVRAAFSGWDGACRGRLPCTFSPEQDVAVRASFGPARHRLAIRVLGPGRVLVRRKRCTSRCATRVIDGTPLALRAAPRRGARLLGWRGACSGRALVCHVTPSRSLGVTAVFARRS